MLGDRVEGRALEVERPGRWPVISLDGLHPFEHATVIRCQLDGPPKVDTSIHPDENGTYRLDANAAILEGPNIRVESYPGEGGQPVANIGYWNSTDAKATWALTSQPGRYRVWLDHAVAEGEDGSVLRLQVGGNTLELPLSQSTGSWQAFQPLEVGFVEIPASGDPIEVTLEATTVAGAAAVNVRSITLGREP